MKKINPGRNLLSAVFIGILLGTVTITAVSFYPFMWCVLLAIVLGIANFELGEHLSKKYNGYSSWPNLVMGEVLLFISYFCSYKVTLAGLGIGCLILSFFYLFWNNYGLANKKNFVGMIISVAISWLSFFWIFLPGLLVVNLVSLNSGAYKVIAFILIVVASDMGGYFAGIMFGKHLLSPLISPKKTWEGLMGSVLAGTIVGTIFVSSILSIFWLEAAIFSVLLVLVAICGDLFESQIKRELGIKDMGKLLPGHGGILDRLDSLLPAAVVAWIFFVVLIG